MSESSLDNLSWMHGLQDYFEFKGYEQEKEFVDQILSVFYSNNKANSVKNLCLSDVGPEEHKLSRFNFYFKLLETTDIDLVEVVSKMRQRLSNVELLNFLHRYFRSEYDIKHVQDSLSRGQVRSKIWLVEELEKLTGNLEDVLLIAGWMGQLTMYLKDRVEFSNLRVVDMDREACFISDFNTNLDYLEGYVVKSVNQNIDEINLTNQGYELYIENLKKDEPGYRTQFCPQTIINTSSEHMTDDWFFNLKNKKFSVPPLVAIQSNNLFDIPEHINCVHSIDHMKKKFPMTEVLYEGEIQLQGYKRFMIIGKVQ